MKRLFTLFLLSIASIILFAQNVSFESRTDIPEKYTWDFTHIFSDWDAWTAEFKNIEAALPKISEYKGKLGESAENLEEFSKMQDEVSKSIMKVYAYVMLQRSIDGKNQEFNSKMQEIHTLFSKIGMATSWVSSEMVAIPKEKMDEWTTSNEYLKESRYSLMDMYRLQDHVLSAEKEEVLSYYSKALGASGQAYKALANADMEYPEVTLSDGSKVVASPVGVKNVMVNNENQEDRLLVSTEHRKAYTATKNTYASIFSGIMESRWANANSHGYESCLESAFAGDNIPVEVYQSLIKTARENTTPLKKYLKLRKEALGLEKYYGSDGMVELVNFESKTTFDASKELLLNAFKPMGEKYTDKIAFAYDNRWMDVYETTGKEPGAYNLGLYSVHPYIMLNYGGTLDDDFTIAHELGHCMQSVFSNEKQPYATAQYSRFVAEVASTFNEHLLMDYLINKSTNPNEKISLLVQQIENIYGTFYRQAWYADWEYQMYSTVEKGMPINEQILSDKWDELYDVYYAETVEKTGFEKYNWARVMHFYELYYYVYQYATSYSASAKLSNDVLNGSKKDKKAATERYIEFISAGGSDYPINLLKNAGVDLTSAEPFEAVVAQMTKLVDQLEVELRKVGKIK
ncbi:MAG: oligoendopeptidase F [Salinivirgaceae bacterium]|nr:oligoendopeptidase F [Salinivirgaceae bacterium]